MSTHERAESPDEAIEITKRFVRGSRRRDAIEAIGRRYESEDQVAIRIEIKGPGGRGGMDVRGDGGRDRVDRAGCSAQLLDGDDPYEALAQRLSVGP